MSSYKIERWDVVMFGNSTTRVPMIYIKPDIAFLEFVKDNKFSVVCEISGTGTEYDNKEIPGVVDKSCNVPNCRTNFCEKTGYYIISLWANWYGYPDPDKLGIVKFSGLNASENHSGQQKQNGLYTLGAPKTLQSTQNKSFNTTRIFIVIGIIIFGCIAVIVISENVKEKLNVIIGTVVMALLLVLLIGFLLRKK